MSPLLRACDTFAGILEGLCTFYSFLQRITFGPLYIYLFFDTVHSPTVWWWVLYILECDVIVIVILRFGDRSSLSHFDPGRGCLGGDATIGNVNKGAYYTSVR